jgi:hypothetical protein
MTSVQQLFPGKMNPNSPGCLLREEDFSFDDFQDDFLLFVGRKRGGPFPKRFPDQFRVGLAHAFVVQTRLASNLHFWQADKLTNPQSHMQLSPTVKFENNYNRNGQGPMF